MGMYTEFGIKATISKSVTDQKAMDVIKFMFFGAKQPELLPDHKFFNCSRWRVIGNYLTFDCSVNFDIANYITLSAYGEIKNYEGEVELFFDWIDPYVLGESGEKIGFHWYCEDEKPTLIYKK